MNAAAVRTLVPSLVCVLFVILVAGCAQTGKTGKADDADDMVNVGYGTQKKGNVTGSVSTISTDQGNERTVTQVAELFEGRAAGVQVSRAPGGGVHIRIRGASSFYGSTEPLFVVDGVPVSPDIGGTLGFLNPNDIAEIAILKDAAATSIYGVRGANGVVLITTKR